MQHSVVTHERMLSNQHASTSASYCVDARPLCLIPRHRKPVRLVLAAATQSTARPIAKPSDTDHGAGAGPGRVFLSSTRAAAGQLWGVLKFFQAEEQAALSPQSDAQVLGDTAKRAEQAEKVQDKAKAKKEKDPPADISKYLRGAGLMETRYVRMVSSLCAQTYYMHKLTKESLWRRHRLHLVTTSQAFKRTDALKSAQQTLDEGDGMSLSPREVQTTQQEVISPTKSQQQAAALTTLSKKVEAEPRKAKALSPSELVAQGLAAAAAAAAHAAAPFASFGNAVPFRAVTSRMQSAAAAGQSTAVATIATVTAAVSSNFNKEHGKMPKESQAADPTQWFVCDDLVSHTRYFVMQGSETIDHWRVNLSFDPVVFEDKSLGVKVHRGVYVAAEILYERFKPMVEEQLASSPFAKVAFTGHSLGGSLGTLLMMMYKHRGVLPQTAIAPVYTFGAPAIFCEGACCAPCKDGSGFCDLTPPSEADADAAAASTHLDTSATEPVTDNDGHLKSQGILQALGLEAGCVRNIFMSKDIVPRAFACDYTLVADLLRRVGEGFREHDCLTGNGRVVMYFFVGKMMILQPDRDHKFIGQNEQYHDMLPSHPGLWVLRQPNEAAIPQKKAPSLAAIANGELADASHAAVKSTTHSAQSKVSRGASNSKLPSEGHSSSKGFDSRPRLKSLPALDSGKSKKASVALAKGEQASASTAVAVAAPQKGKPAASLREAVMDLMNYPHPLDILGDPGAYGPEGAISRYHNPDHYCQAIGGVLRVRTKPLRMNLKSPRWYLHLQEKEQAMKRKVRSMRHARHESKKKQQHQLQLQLQKQHSQQKYQPPPSVLNEWKRASQHAG